MKSLWLVLLLVASAAHAADHATEAEAEMIKAKQAMERRQFDIAVGHLLVARSLAPEASGPYLNLGLSYAALGRCADAVPMLEEYLRRKTKDPQPAAAATLAACRAATPDEKDGPLAPRTVPRPDAPPPPPPSSTSPAPATTPHEAPLPAPLLVPAPAPGKLIVEIGPVAARVVLNGETAAQETRRYESVVSPGNYTLQVESKGYQATSRYLFLDIGQTRTETVTLQKKRVWPTVVGVLVGVAATAAIVAVIVTQTTGSSGSDEVGFSRESTR